MRPGMVSVLPPELDELTGRIIGCAMRVHKELGPGFLESIYSTALAFELHADGISYERERPIIVNYRGVLPISGQRIDFVVEASVILESKQWRGSIRSSKQK